MTITKTFNNYQYDVPETGEVGWGDEVTSLLCELADYSNTKVTQLQKTRIATTTPQNLDSQEDWGIVMNVAGFSRVNLPESSVGQIFVVADGSGAAETNTIEIYPPAGQTICGDSSAEISSNFGTKMFQFVGDNKWYIINTGSGGSGGGGDYTDAKARAAIANAWADTTTTNFTFTPGTPELKVDVIYDSASLAVGASGLKVKDNTYETKQTKGSISETGSSVLTVSNGSSSTVGPNVTIQVKKATNSQDGYLASLDWTTFNNKENSLGNPLVDGYLLSSTAAGVRSWVVPSNISGSGTSGKITTWTSTSTIGDGPINNNVSTISFEKVLLGLDGSVGTPSYGFINDTNTGLYLIGSDNLGISIGGTKRVDINGTIFNINTLQLKTLDGTVSSPAVIGNTNANTGIYFPSDKHIAISSDSQQKILITNSATTFPNNTVGITQSLTVGTTLTVDSTITTKAGIYLEDPGAGTNKVGLIAPTLISDWTMTLPTSAGVNGYILQTDGTGNTTWVAQSVTNTSDLTTTSPLRGSGNDVLVGNTNVSITIDQATTTTDGYLSSTDWTIFNNKVATTRNINTNGPLFGGGNLSADRTLYITKSDTSTDGYLTSGDWNTFNGKVTGAGTVTDNAIVRFDNTSGKLIQNSLVTISDTGSISLPAGETIDGIDVSVLNDGYLTHATDSSIHIPTSRTISTSAPLSGGGDLSSNRTFSIIQASGSQDGYLSSTDWTTFNNKVSTTRAINTSAPLQGGGNLSADRTLSMTQASGSTDGYLTSTDWNTFNNKQSTISVGTIDSQTKSANGLVFTGNVLYQQTADATYPGLVSTTTQTFAGTKSFNSFINVGTDYTTDATNAITVYSHSDDNFSSGLFIKKAGNASDGVGGPIKSGAEIGYHSFYGKHTTSTDASNYGRAAYVIAKATQDWSPTAYGTSYAIYTTPNNSTTNTLALFIGNDQTVQFKDGTAAAPTITFNADTDTGIYRSGANLLGVTVGGAQVAQFQAGTLNIYYSSANGTGAYNRLYKSGSTDGTTASVKNGTNLGYLEYYGRAVTDGAYARGALYKALTTQDWTVSANGTKMEFYTTPNDSTTVTLAMTIWQNQQVGFTDGTAALPSITFNSDLDTGIYGSGSNTIYFSTGGTNKVTISDILYTNNIGASDGTTNSPAFKFTNEATTGIYRIGAGNIGVSCNSSKILDIATTGLSVTGDGYFSGSIDCGTF